MNKVFIVIFLISSVLLAQKKSEPNKENNSILFSINHTAQIPYGDLEKRFGYNSDVSAILMYKSSNNWIYNFEAGFLFGSDIKEDNIFDNIDGIDGDIISPVGEVAVVRQFQRGGHIDVSVGKYFSLKNKKHESGIVMSVGSGYMYHKIFIETITTELPQLTGDLLKGYDRLCGGILLKQFIGYFFFSNSNNVRFLIGLEAVQGFTKELRGYNYTTQTYNNSNRRDYLFGLKSGLIIPLKKRRTGKKYYY